MPPVFRWITLFAVIALAVLLHPHLVTAQQAAPSAGEARSVMAEINAWRLQIGLPPLNPNPVLERMALEQAQYVASLPQIPSGADIHIGARGDDPRTRALFPANNWPVYGSREQLVFSEIAAAQPNASRAVRWWQNSELHTRQVSNGWYREFGAAAIPYRLGFIYIVVLAAEPNVLPAMADPRAGVLYLSNETYPRGQGNWLRSATQVRLFDAEGRPLTDWVTWQSQLPLPATNGDKLYVAYRNGDQQVVTEVSLSPANVLLPQYADAWGAPAVAVAGSASATPVPPTAVIIATNTPAPQIVQLATNTPLPGVIIPTSAALVPTAVPPTQPPPPPNAAVSGPSVSLVYDATTLAVIPSQTGLNITGIVLTGGTARPIRFANLFTQGLRGTLTSLNARDCLLVSINNAVRTAGSVSACGFLATTFLTPDRALWTSDFIVELNGLAAAQCRAADGRCAVAIR